MSTEDNRISMPPETSIPNWQGDQMDNGMAVDMLLDCEWGLYSDPI